MSTDMRSEDDIARLFADANPIPNPTGPAATHPAEPWTSATPDAALVDLADPPRTDEATGPAGRWGAIAAAAAIVLLVAGLVFVVIDDDATPADENPSPTSITTPDTLAPVPVAITSGPVIDLIDAFNARDADGMRRALGDAVSPQTTEQVEGVIDDFAWYDAFGWRWIDVRCDAPTDATVRCDVTERNRLTDYTGVTRSVELVATLDDGAIERLALSEESQEYSTAAFEPFQEWVVASDPDDYLAMWFDDSIDPVDRARLFDAYLTRFTADPEPPTPVHRAFLAAHARDASERPDIVAMFAPDGTISGGWTDDPVRHTEALDVLRAIGFDWGEPSSCRVPPATRPPRIQCGLRPTTSLDEAGLRMPGQRVSFVVTADGIRDVVANDMDGTLDTALAPFYDWMADQHPDDAAVLLVDDGERLALALDPAGAPRLTELVDEYVSAAESSAGAPTEPDD